MARGVVQKYSIGLKLNNGTTTTGAIKTVNIGLAPTSNKITITNYAGTDEASISTGRAKALAIAAALENCLTKAIFEIQETRIADIVD